jgi:hypothetical protein
LPTRLKPPHNDAGGKARAEKLIGRKTQAQQFWKGPEAREVSQRSGQENGPVTKSEVPTMRTIFTIAMLLCLPLRWSLGQDQQGEPERIAFHITAVRSEEASDWCTTKERGIGLLLPDKGGLGQHIDGQGLLSAGKTFLVLSVATVFKYSHD